MISRLAALGVLIGAALGLVAPSGAAAAAPPDDVDGARVLAERYAPVMMLKAQTEECDTTGEPYAPAAVEIVLDNPEVLLRQIGRDDPVLMRAPGASDLFRLGDGTYLDFPGDALRPGCTFERDFRRFTEAYPATVYAHVATQADRPGLLALQYWFFWYYNDWNNRHEGDWEGIQLLFEASSVAEALASEPVSVGYAQHEGGERVRWGDARLEREGDRPVVYSSAGSHASYFSSALYLGRSGSEGFGCDDTTGPSDRIDPEVVLLPAEVTDPDDPLAWLMYDGRWGEVRVGPYSGPTGPRDKERWEAPVEWQESLRTSSVVVPAGDSGVAQVAQAFCGVVGWGSTQVIRLQVSPVLLLIVAGVLALVVVRLARRTSWTLVPPMPVVARRRVGQILRVAPRLALGRWRAVLTIGLVYLPVAALAGLAVALLRSVPVVRQLLELGGERSGTGALVALMVGGLVNLIAYQVVLAATARLLTAPPDGVDEGSVAAGVAAVRSVAARLHDLVTGLLRATVIVGVLLVSVVGIPWGIRQLVRYQFLSPVVMREGLGGAPALARSSALVRGRWAHTALVIVLLNLIAGGLGTAVGLLLLVVLQVLPLWMFSVLVALISVVVVPLVAVAQTLVYGDAVAQASSDDPAGGSASTDAAADAATPELADH